MNRRARPRVVVVTSQLDAVGGIPSYVRSVLRALEPVAQVRVVDLSITGTPFGYARAFFHALSVIMWSRPDLVLLGHVGFGPIGRVWQLVGGRYAVMAYGIDVWSAWNRGTYNTLYRADLVWPISTFTRTEVLRTAPGARVGPVLGGTIDESFFQSHEDVPGAFRIAFVATLADLAYKGTDTLIDAAQRLAADHDIEVRIVGSGPATAALEAHVAEHDRAGVVRMIGRVDAGQLLDEYRRADALVLLTRFARGPEPRGEGLGLVLLEAAAAETPVIGSRVGGSTDTIVEGETGYLLSPGDVDALEGALRGWIEDPDSARRMGLAGRRFVEEQHAFGPFSDRIHDALQRSIAG